MLCCFVRIDLGFFSLFHCVIRRPMLCHYGAQAWVEAAGERGSALFLSLSLCVSQRSSSACPLLSVCPSVCVCLTTFICLYFSPPSLPLPPRHTRPCKCEISPGSFLLSFFSHVLLFPAVKAVSFTPKDNFRWL